MRILVVENDLLVREPMVEGLRQAGYETFEASSGPEALTLMDLQKPEVLVADVPSGKRYGLGSCRTGSRGQPLTAASLPRLRLIPRCCRRTWSSTLLAETQGASVHRLQARDHAAQPVRACSTALRRTELVRETTSRRPGRD
jgi:CheY-like chemotaxis protein